VQRLEPPRLARDCLDNEVDLLRVHFLLADLDRARLVGLLVLGQALGDAKKLPAALAQLGIPFPIPWPEAWERGRVKTVRALGDIRGAVWAKRLAAVAPAAPPPVAHRRAH